MDEPGDEFVWCLGVTVSDLDDGDGGAAIAFLNMVGRVGVYGIAGVLACLSLSELSICGLGLFHEDTAVELPLGDSETLVPAASGTAANVLILTSSPTGNRRCENRDVT